MCFNYEYSMTTTGSKVVDGRRNTPPIIEAATVRVVAFRLDEVAYLDYLVHNNILSLGYVRPLHPLPQSDMCISRLS